MHACIIITFVLHLIELMRSNCLGVFLQKLNHLILLLWYSKVLVSKCQAVVCWHAFTSEHAACAYIYLAIRTLTKPFTRGLIQVESRYYKGLNCVHAWGYNYIDEVQYQIVNIFSLTVVIAACVCVLYYISVVHIYCYCGLTDITIGIQHVYGLGATL